MSINRAESNDAAATPAEEPQSTEGALSGQESWIERLKSAVGLKPAVSLREDLAGALAGGDAGMAGFSAEERAMLANILRLRDVRVDDVMTPRSDIEAVEIGVTLGELLLAFERSGHSRMPVYRESLDDPVGLVHIKDLMSLITRAAAADGAVALDRVDLSRKLSAEETLIREILFVPPSMPVTALLAGMQASRMQMALVIDEYGGTDGLVSIEDVIEMVVGDIEDEHDDEEAPTIVPDGEGGFLADARADLDEVSKALGVELAPGDDTEDVDTIGGLVFSLLGRIPVRGELVTVPGGYELEILDADPRRIKRLRIHRRVAGEPRRRRTAAPGE